MASSYRIPHGYRMTDPDETEGRCFARKLAERDARQSIAMGRKVRLRALTPGEGGNG